MSRTTLYVGTWPCYHDSVAQWYSREPSRRLKPAKHGSNPSTTIRDFILPLPSSLLLKPRGRCSSSDTFGSMSANCHIARPAILGFLKIDISSAFALSQIPTIGSLLGPNIGRSIASKTWVTIHNAIWWFWGQMVIGRPSNTILLLGFTVWGIYLGCKQGPSTTGKHQIATGLDQHWLLISLANSQFNHSK